MRWASGFFLPAAAWLACAWASAAGVRADGLEASLASDRRFFYEGDPIALRLVLRNGGDTRLRLGKDAAAGVEILTADGAALSAAGAAGPIEVRTLDPGAAQEVPIDLSSVAGLRRAGAYRIAWRGDAGVADALEIRVIPRYDPQASHVARLETTEGEIELRLLSDVSPLAVKVFVDLARAGFYDGTRFHRVVRGSHVVAGEQPPAAAPGSSVSFPGEQTDAPVVAGSVIFEPIGAAPPQNGPALMIAVRPQPAWTGQVTVLGEVTRGLEIVERISRLPTAADDPGRPLRSVAILGVSIAAAPAPAPGP